MKQLKETDIENKIHAYVDGLLEENEKNTFEEVLLENKDLSEKVSDYQKQKRLLNNLYQPVLQEAIPDPILIRARFPNRGRKLFNFAASIILVAFGCSLGWFLKSNQIKESEIIVKLAQPAAAAYAVYSPEIKHPVEVFADQEQHLVKWLSKRLGKNVLAPDLNPLGFQLVGGRLLPAESGPAAQFMYQNSAGERLTLYVSTNQSEKNNTAFRYHEQNDIRTFYWIDGELGYALTGTLDKQQLIDSANSVYHQLAF